MLYSTRKFIIWTFVFVVVLAFPLNVSAVAVERTDWGADDDIAVVKEEYVYPTKIHVVMFNSQNDHVNDSEEFVRNLYYYFSTRSGFGDFPFHYIVTWDGKVYEANKGGNETKVDIGGETDSLFIAYFPSETGELGPLSVGSIKEVLLANMNEYAIGAKKVSISKIGYKIGERGEMNDVQLSKVGDETQSGFSSLLKSISKNYSPKKKIFTLEIIDVIVPTEKLLIDQTSEVRIKVKNTGENSIYSSSNIFITTKSQEQSVFYLSDKWDSPKQTSLLSTGERLAPGEEKEVILTVRVPLYPPEISEEFVITDTNGSVLKNTDFKIKMLIEKGDKSIVEIKDTSVGYLNVRSTPGLGDVVTKVIPGERYIVVGSEDGYYKIQANGKEGWVVASYVTVI
ncbi:MAG: SH3 domain-containing protein [Candidatus Dojkabacteria bacterium]|nr:SH3 domain-containing protein [Candidatus Dojkabacteria bacterium]